MTSLFRKMQWWLQRRRRERELREELQFHLTEEMEERRADGFPADEAARAARRDLGNATLVREDARTLWSWMLLEQLTQDLRYGLRGMFRNRMFTALARRQHRDLQLHGLDPGALAPGGGSRVTDCREVAEPSGDQRDQGPVRDAFRGRPHLSGFLGGKDRPNLPVSRVRAPARGVGAGAVQSLRT
jgi:hypothetical protein